MSGDHHPAAVRRSWGLALRALAKALSRWVGLCWDVLGSAGEAQAALQLAGDCLRAAAGLDPPPAEAGARRPREDLPLLAAYLNRAAAFDGSALQSSPASFLAAVHATLAEYRRYHQAHPGLPAPPTPPPCLPQPPQLCPAALRLCRDLGQAAAAAPAPHKTVPTVLIIAGSDSSGGAGIQADLKACEATGSFGMTAISALTAQNTRGVTGIHSVPTDFVEEQLRACVDDIGVRVFKTGMLSDPSTAKMIARVARELDAGDSRRGGGIKLVVDPVMVAASGSALASTAVVQAMLTDLLPAAFLITPNLLEAAVLLGREGEHICPLDSLEESLVAAARQLCEKTGARNVLLKGSHAFDVLPKGEHPERCVDVLCGKDVSGPGHVVLESPWVVTENVHGTGCTLASAISSFLASGSSAEEAVFLARAYVAATLAKSAPVRLGTGPNGPMIHSPIAVF
ncbi:putative hydroxymethylpyrimidine/phosphomethylpyrimidine kinase 2 [Diplonema papillatum]|nr:putative hydroxymethylpyrimidine/phosphomethylpyrimidine kinase 2 [Diplonema papillatum]